MTEGGKKVGFTILLLQLKGVEPDIWNPFCISGGLESVRIQFLPILKEIRKCQNWKVSESESVRIGKCQNWKVSELESVRIGKCRNRKVSELESVRIFWVLKTPYKWAK